MIVAVFISDRGDLYLPDCVKSFDEHMPYEIWATHVVDDRDHRLGMAGAVQAGFEWALSTLADYVLWVEEDFRFTAPIELDAMAHILKYQTDLAQVVLKRQPWSRDEIAAGGQIETNPDAYTDCSFPGGGKEWVEHSTLFSLNPCLIPRRTLELGWPAGPLGVGNESGFTKRCLEAGMRFAYYGHRDDPPRCEHVGHQRASGWRL